MLGVQAWPVGGPERGPSTAQSGGSHPAGLPGGMQGARPGSLHSHGTLWELNKGDRYAGAGGC
jgi:hypothetical protein